MLIIFSLSLTHTIRILQHGFKTYRMYRAWATGSIRTITLRGSVKFRLTRGMLADSRLCVSVLMWADFPGTVGNNLLHTLQYQGTINILRPVFFSFGIFTQFLTQFLTYFMTRTRSEWKKGKRLTTRDGLIMVSQDIYGVWLHHDASWSGVYSRLSIYYITQLYNKHSNFLFHNTVTAADANFKLWHCTVCLTYIWYVSKLYFLHNWTFFIVSEL